MGLFRRLFSRRKKRQELLEPVENEQEELSFEDVEIDQHKIGHFVLDHCEQIIDSAKELGEEKKEYNIVTSYLKDIELLTEMPAEQKEPICDAAENILRLNEARDTYLNTAKKISDVQFLMFEQQEQDIPDTIRRMQTNEAYQATIKSDMSYLEGEKMQWTLLRSEKLHEKYLLRIASYVAFSVFCLLMILLFVLQAGFSVDITWGWIVVAALGAGGGFFIFIRYLNASKAMERARVNANYAISLLNKTKVKYVNITNAVDYAREKYHVRNAKEMEYQWEQYQEAVKERERMNLANQDLDYYSRKLVKELKKYQLYDADVWTDQPRALVNDGEMSELKHNLLVRRQKIRARIQYNAETVEEERGKIDRLMQLHPEYEEEIRGIIQSVDQLATGDL
jgi:hypothetical protein